LRDPPRDLYRVGGRVKTQHIFLLEFIGARPVPRPKSRGRPRVVVFPENQGFGPIF
jgi:hypothetical protein